MYGLGIFQGSARHNFSCFLLADWGEGLNLDFCGLNDKIENNAGEEGGGGAGHSVNEWLPTPMSSTYRYCVTSLKYDQLDVFCNTYMSITCTSL